MIQVANRVWLSLPTLALSSRKPRSKKLPARSKAGTKNIFIFQIQQLCNQNSINLMNSFFIFVTRYIQPLRHIPPKVGTSVIRNERFEGTYICSTKLTSQWNWLLITKIYYFVHFKLNHITFFCCPILQASWVSTSRMARLHSFASTLLFIFYCKHRKWRIFIFTEGKKC